MSKKYSIWILIGLVGLVSRSALGQFIRPEQGEELIDLTKGFELNLIAQPKPGYGYDSKTGEVKPQCINGTFIPGTKNSVPESIRQKVDFEMVDSVRSISDQQFFTLDAAFGYESPGTSVSASAGMFFRRTSSQTDNFIQAKISAKAVSDIESFQEAYKEALPNWNDLGNNAKKQTVFRQRCGDSYISDVFNGAAYIASMSVVKLTQEETRLAAQDFGTIFKGFGSNLKLSGESSDKLTSMFSRSNFKFVDFYLGDNPTLSAQAGPEEKNCGTSKPGLSNGDIDRMRDLGATLACRVTRPPKIALYVKIKKYPDDVDTCSDANCTDEEDKQEILQRVIALDNRRIGLLRLLQNQEKYTWPSIRTFDKSLVDREIGKINNVFDNIRQRYFRHVRQMFLNKQQTSPVQEGINASSQNSTKGRTWADLKSDINGQIQKLYPCRKENPAFMPIPPAPLERQIYYPGVAIKPLETDSAGHFGDPDRHMAFAFLGGWTTSGNHGCGQYGPMAHCENFWCPGGGCNGGTVYMKAVLRPWNGEPFRGYTTDEFFSSNQERLSYRYPSIPGTMEAGPFYIPIDHQIITGVAGTSPHGFLWMEYNGPNAISDRNGVGVVEIVHPESVFGKNYDTNRPTSCFK